MYNKEGRLMKVNIIEDLGKGIDLNELAKPSTKEEQVNHEHGTSSSTNETNRE
jgi:hypothetical protein